MRLDKIPDMNFFWVGTSSGQRHLFGTLESSLGLLAIQACGIKNASSISIHEKHSGTLNGKLYFAETRKLYVTTKLKEWEELKEDYLIVKLSQLKQ